MGEQGMKTTRVLSYLLCGLLGAVACGDDSEGAGSGVDAEKPAGDLSEGEAMDLCDAVNAAGPTKEQSCTFAAALQSADKASCETAAKACVDEPEEGGDCDDVQETLKGCTAKTGDIETCFTEQAAAAKKLLASVTCDDAGNPPTGGDDGGEQAEPSAACKAVQAACPDLFGDN